MTPAELKGLIRTIPDFPAAGIQFRDITTLIAHGEGLAATVDHLVERARLASPAAVAGIEARGFIFGAAVAARLGLGFVPLRKAGKLPVETIGIDYALEYGSARLELDPGAQLLRQAEAVVDHALFVIDLPDLGGGEALRAAGIEAEALFDFPGH